MFVFAFVYVYECECVFEHAVEFSYKILVISGLVSTHLKSIRVVHGC